MSRLDKLSRFHELRKEFPEFTYDSYQYYFSGNALEIRFSFNLSGKYFFNPGISIPYKRNLFLPFDSLSASSIDNLVFQCGMIELISYWKAACPPKVIIKPHSLSAPQVKFWKKIYFNGLGEFFYMNSIQVKEDEFMELNFPKENPAADFRLIIEDGCLVPVGGGKDSAVTMGLLNKSGSSWLPFVINPRAATNEVILAAGKNEDQTIDFYREIHPQLLKLNNEGFLNGHTPFSALLAFYSLLAAYLTGRHEIILSNESSANEVTVPGTTINHQYSKSVEFERDFREYTQSSLSPGFNYFSLLRPLTELQIAGLFSGMPQYFHHFKSCNVGSKTDSWCGSCPKCLFTFVILSPFVKPETLVSIFGHNLLDDPALEKTMEELSGIADVKPFECIGTIDEVNASLNEAIKMYKEESLPILLKTFQQNRRLVNSSQENFQQLTGRMDPDHFLSGHYLNLLIKALR
jgi:UDP-N-acetyl-alpha-D-muramoyl-L-alanyl-L-glutamate epimerase